MKPMKAKHSGRHPTARTASRLRAGASTEKASSRRAVAAGSRKPPRLKSSPPPAPASVRRKSPGSQGGPPPIADEILREVQAIRAAVAPKHRPSSGEAGELESAVDSLRRLLSELLERHHDAVLSELVPIRLALADAQHPDPAAALLRIDRLMDRLGATQFTAQRLDFVDPAIHEVKAERRLVGVADGVVAESLRPGFRNASGVVLTKAWVAVNRSLADEPSRY